MAKKNSIIDQLRRAIADREDSELTIALVAGVPQSALNRFMRGERGISLETAAKLCRVLRLELRQVR